MKYIVTALALAAALAATPTFADKPETPKAIAGAKVVSAAEAKSIAGAVFIDTRSAVNFGKGHVPGAKTAAYKEKSDPVEAFDASKDEFELAKLPQDKAAKIVFYSDGPTGWKSYKAAVTAVKAGYKNVAYMRGGFTEWEASGNAVER